MCSPSINPTELSGHSDMGGTQLDARTEEVQGAPTSSGLGTIYLLCPTESWTPLPTREGRELRELQHLDVIFKQTQDYLYLFVQVKKMIK